MPPKVYNKVSDRLLNSVLFNSYYFCFEIHNITSTVNKYIYP